MIEFDDFWIELGMRIMLNIPLHRRRFLRWSAGTGTALLSLSAAGCAASARPTPSSRRFLVLSPGQALLVEQIAEALLPHGSGWPDARTAEVAQRLDEELFFAAPQIQDDFRLAIKVVNALPLLYGRFRFFDALPLAARQDCLRATEDTRFENVRAAVNGCRMAIYMMYFGHASTWSALHYDGPHGRVAPQLSEQRQLYRQLTEV